MRYRDIPALHRRVSVIGFGTWSLGGESFGGRTVALAREQERESVLAVHRALELGISFFDTADSYGGGQAERILGEALAQKPEAEVVISTKFGARTEGGVSIKDFSAAQLQRSVEGSLQRLRRERIDLLLLHNPPDDFDWTSYPVAPLEALRRQGRVGAYGVSCATIHGAAQVLAAGFGQAVEVVYNALDRRPEEEVLSRAAAQGVAVIARVPLASGFLTGQFAAVPTFSTQDVRSTLPEAEARWRWEATQRLGFLNDLPGGMPAQALRFCASHPAVSTVIPGMRTAVEVEQNASAAEPLSPEVLERIRQAVPEHYSGWK